MSQRNDINSRLDWGNFWSIATIVNVGRIKSSHCRADKCAKHRNAYLNFTKKWFYARNKIKQNYLNPINII